MNEEGVRWAGAVLGIALKPEISSTGWIEAPCPYAPWTHASGQDENPSFAISVSGEDHRHSNFICHTCKRKGRLPALSYELGRLRHHARVDLDTDYVALGQKFEEIELRGVPRELPKTWDDDHGDEEERPQHHEVEPLDLPSAVGHPYLGKRGILWNTAISLGLLHDEYRSRIVFPVRDYRGRLKGYTGRSYRPTFLRDGRPAPKVRDYLGLPKRELLLGEDRVRPRHAQNGRFSPIVVVEGLFDYARLTQHGVRNVVALLGSALTPEKLARLRYFDMPIVWMTDPDEAGKACLYGPVDPITGNPELEKGALHMLYQYVPQMLVEYPRPVDPGELTRAEVIGMLAKARLYRR